jgi:hypothetical protein
MSHTENTIPEYVTLMAPSQELVTAEFARQGLGQQGYAIIGPIGRHRVTLMDDAGSHPEPGREMFTATYRREQDTSQRQRRMLGGRDAR